MVTSRGRITTFLTLVLGVVLSTVSSAVSEVEQGDFAELAAAALVDSRTYSPGSTVLTELGNWIWLAKQPDLTERFRSHLPEMHRSWKELSSNLARCLKLQCAAQEVRFFTQDLTTVLDMQGRATDKSVAESLGPLAQALRDQGVAVLSAGYDLSAELEFQVARALLVSSNGSGDSTHRLKAVQEIERLNLKYGDLASTPIGLGSRVGQLSANIDAFEATAERKWIDFSLSLAGQISSHRLDVAQESIDRVALARSASEFARLENYYGTGAYRQIAEANLKRAAEGSHGSDVRLAAVALAGSIRLAKQPLHITIVSPWGHPAGKALYEQALQIRNPHRQLEWLDPSTGAFLGGVRRYPPLKQPGAFVCVEKRCSLPVFDPQNLARTVNEMAG